MPKESSEISGQLSDADGNSYVAPSPQLAESLRTEFLSPPPVAGLVPNVPDVQSEGPPLPPRKRLSASVFALSKKRDSYASTSNGSTRRASIQPNLDLLQYRIEEGSAASVASSIKDDDGSTTQSILFKDRFDQIRSESGDPLVFEESEEMSVWKNVVMGDYTNFARTHLQELSYAIAGGIPADVRGVVWQAMANSKSSSLEELYSSIIAESTPVEQHIHDDLEQLDIANKESLFRVLKGYSLFDPEVGYTKDLALIATPLVCNMSELEAFGLLVKLMKSYKLRELYADGPQLILYQFDRILEDSLPEIHINLSRKGVRSSVYASSWFLSLFGLVLDLNVLQRLYDVVIAEGIEATLKFAVGVIRRNASKIMELEFSELSDFMKNHLFDIYIEKEGFNDGNSTVGLFKIDQFIGDAYEVKILPLTLQKYVNEYVHLHSQETERNSEVESLRQTHQTLMARISKLEQTIETLSSEHLLASNELKEQKKRSMELDEKHQNAVNTKKEIEQELAEKTDGLGENPLEELATLKAQNSEIKEELQDKESHLTELEEKLITCKNKQADVSVFHVDVRDGFLLSPFKLLFLSFMENLTNLLFFFFFCVPFLFTAGGCA